MDRRQLDEGQRALTIEEVRMGGRPATFSAFGDHLVYLDGTIYAVPQEPKVCELASLPGLAEAYEVVHVVGIEYGWYQVERRALAPSAEVPQAAVIAQAHSEAGWIDRQATPTLRWLHRLQARRRRYLSAATNRPATQVATLVNLAARGRSAPNSS
jgi:hypothetical protein